jgi:hypothetical protein
MSIEKTNIEMVQTVEKPWRDMYFFFQEAFCGDQIYGPINVSAFNMESMLQVKYPGSLYNIDQLKDILQRHFTYSIEANNVVIYHVTKSHYHTLLHEIHRKDLPAELLPFNYKQSINK